MSTRYELEILLKARNQLGDSFKAAKAAVADLQGGVHGYGDAAEKAGAKAERAAKMQSAVWVGVGAAVAGAVAGVGLAARAIVDLGMRGSEIGGVKTAFDLLTAAVGGSTAMLEAGRTGTRGLITDYDLMLNANRLLAAKLPITASQFSELSGQAIALGRSVGKDATESLHRMALGLSKLEPELLDEINIKVDAVSANRKYAESLGVSMSALTGYQRQLAFVNAVMEQARERSQALGGIQLTFADHVKIVTNGLKNMYDQLAVGVSLSPAVMTLVQQLGASLLDAFGPNQEKSIKNIVGWVDRFALFLIDAAQAGVSTAKFIGMAWLDLKIAFDDTGATLARVAEVSAKVQAWQREQLASVPWLGRAYKSSAEQTRQWATELENLRVGYETNAKTGRETLATWRSGTDGVSKSLTDLRARMVAASAAGITQATVANALSVSTSAHGTAAGGTSEKLKGYAKTLDEVTKGLRDAEKNQAPANIVLAEYGAKIEAVVRHATIAGKEIPDVVQKWHTAMLRNELTPILQRQIDALHLTSAAVKGARDQFQGLTPSLSLSAQAAVHFAGDLSALNEQLGVGVVRMETAKAATIDLSAGIDEATEAAQRMRDEVADRSARDILSAFQTLAFNVGGVFGDIVAQWNSMLGAMISSSEASNGKLWQWLSSGAGQKVSGGLQVGVQTFTQGYGLGTGLGKTGGALAGAGAGAAQGALVGTYLMPGLGTGMGALIGGAAGAVGGWLGGKKKDKEEKAQLQELQQELLKTYGGMDNLKKLAGELGVSIDGAFSAKKPKEALAVIERFAQATADHKTQLDGLALATDALNVRSGFLFGALGDVDGALVAIGASGQTEFERLGVYADANLSGIIAKTGDVRGAFDTVGPTLDRLRQAQDTLGLTSNDTIDQMLRMRDVVTANGPVLDNLSALTQMTKGWGAAGLMTKGLFQAVAGDIGANLQQMIDGGVGVHEALALSGPTLKWLWEHQQKYGGITDDTTKKLLEQAEAQGLVGDHQKSINQQMLDATLGLQAAVKDLAASLRGDLPAAAADAARGIRDQFADLSFRVPVEYDDGGGYRGGGDTGEYQGFATGGTVPWTPGGRLVRVAEAGTERIVSDAQLGAILSRAMAGVQMGGGGTTIIRNEIGGRHIDELVVDAVNRGIRNGRVVVPKRAVVEKVY